MPVESEADLQISTFANKGNCHALPVLGMSPFVFISSNSSVICKTIIGIDSVGNLLLIVAYLLYYMHAYRVFSVTPPSFYKKLSSLALLPVIALGLLSVEAEAALIGNYEFQGNLENSVSAPGSLPGLTVASPGTPPEAFGYDATGWYWNYGLSTSGLKIDGTSALEAFSIGINFTFSESSGYRKIIDFSNLSSDIGLYIYDHIFTFYIGSIVASGGLAPQETALSIIMTRDDEGLIQVYQKDSATPIITYTDAGGNFTIGSSLAFFLDDRNGGEYSPAGSVSQLRIWDSALSSEEVAVAFEAIPEPGTLSLTGGVGIATLAFRHLLRRRRS